MLGDLLAVLASLVASLSPPAAPAPVSPPPVPEPATAPAAATGPEPASDPPKQTGNYNKQPDLPERVSSTAYCLTGKMANGRRAHVGAVASNRHPLGTRVWLEDSPWGPAEFVVEDRIGWGSQLDFAMPGDCWGARRWGRRRVTVAALS